jgi:imidazolonepropionase-like amidohydrolase
MEGSKLGVVFTDARVIDAVADEPREHVDVLVDDQGRIASIEPHQPRHWAAGDLAHGQSAPIVIDAAGDTLLPGLVDVHAHYTIDPRVEVPDGILDAHLADPTTAAYIGARNAREALLAGVTTARSAGAAHSRDIPLRNAIDAGDIPGPRFFAAGGSITITGGHGWQFGYEADSITDMISLTRRLARDGANHFKIVSSEAAQITSAVAGVEELTLEEVTAIVTEAHRLHRRVMSHAQSSGAVVNSARGGVDSVEHAFLADRGALETLKECGTTLVPTLTVTDVWSTIRGASDAVRANQANLSIKHRWSCETAISLGIPLATGTDCGVRGVMPAMVWREIWNMHDHGLSAIDAIKAGTINGARLIGIEGDVGTVEVGKRADLVLAAGNPLHDLKRLSDLRVVIQNGKVVRGA